VRSATAGQKLPKSYRKIVPHRFYDANSSESATSKMKYCIKNEVIREDAPNAPPLIQLI
jgi:hypothetical protein